MQTDETNVPSLVCLGAWFSRPGFSLFCFANPLYTSCKSALSVTQTRHFVGVAKTRTAILSPVTDDIRPDMPFRAVVPLNALKTVSPTAYT